MKRLTIAITLEVSIGLGVIPVVSISMVLATRTALRRILGEMATTRHALSAARCLLKRRPTRYLTGLAATEALPIAAPAATAAEL